MAGKGQKCCCPAECIIIDESFDRADSTSLGADWTEVSGDWEIVGGELQENATSGAIVISTLYHTRTSFYLYAPLGADGMVSGRKYRLIANYLDASNYHYAEYEYDSGALSITIRLVSASGGTYRTEEWTEDVVADDMVYPYVALALCLDPSIFTATLLNRTTRFISVAQDPPTLVSGGYKVGMGNGAASQINFDSFLATESSYYNSSCQPCPKKCCARCPEWTWDERDGEWYWVGDLCLTLTCADCPELDTSCTLSQTDGLVDADPIDAEWVGNSTGYFNGVEFQLWCENNVADVGCYRYRLRHLQLLTPAVGSGTCGVIGIDATMPPDECECPDIDDFSPEFVLRWFTTVYNSYDGDCADFCADGTEVVIEVKCCAMMGRPPAALRAAKIVPGVPLKRTAPSSRRDRTSCIHRAPDPVGRITSKCGKQPIFACKLLDKLCVKNAPSGVREPYVLYDGAGGETRRDGDAGWDFATQPTCAWCKQRQSD